MAAPSASLLQRLQTAQKGGTLGSIVGQQEAAAWGGRDLASASYEDLVGAFGASDLQDPAAPATPAASVDPAAAAPGAVPPTAGVAGGAGGVGGVGGMGGNGGPAMQMLSAPAAPPAGWAATGGGMSAGADGPLGTRQYPQQGQALRQMMARGKGRVY